MRACVSVCISLRVYIRACVCVRACAHVRVPVCVCEPESAELTTTTAKLRTYDHEISVQLFDLTSVVSGAAEVHCNDVTDQTVQSESGKGNRTTKDMKKNDREHAQTDREHTRNVTVVNKSTNPRSKRWCVSERKKE